MEQMINQIWTQYDHNNNGALDEQASHDFLKEVLVLHEKTVAEALQRDPQPIS